MRAGLLGPALHPRPVDGRDDRSAARAGRVPGLTTYETDPAQLLSSEAWRAIVDGLHEAVVATDESNVVLFVNRAAERLLGWTTAQLLGQPLTTIVPERFRDAHGLAFGRYFATGRPAVMGRPLRVPALRADGTEVAVELVISSAHVLERTVVIGLLRDVSERVELEGGSALGDAILAAVAQTAHLDEAIPRVLHAVGDTLNWDVVQLWLVDADAAALRPRATWSRTPDLTTTFAAEPPDSLPRGTGLPGRVWESGEPAWIEDVAADANFPRRDAAIRAALRSAFAFPLTTNGTTIGVIELLSRDVHGVSDDSLERTARLGAELGAFIERRVAEERRLSLLESERRARAEAERARAQLAFLAEASHLLGETLDPNRTFDRLATLAVPRLGDWCVVHVLDGDDVRVVAANHRDADKVRRLHDAHERYPVTLAASGGVGRAIRERDVVVHHEVSDDVLRQIARDEVHLDLLRELRFGSIVTVPLEARGRCFGTITVASDERRALADDVIESVVELGRRAAMAIDNARLHRDLQLHTLVLRTQGEAGVEGHLVVGPDSRMITSNRRFAEMWRIPPEVIRDGRVEPALAIAAEQVVEPEFATRTRAQFTARRPVRDELVLRDGRVFDVVGEPLTERGAFLGFAWYFRDVTDHKRIERELADEAERSAALARTLQRSLLPPSLPEIPGLQLAGRYVPVGEGTLVGGDFYDVFRIGRDTWGVVIGDVCGHGAEAAAITAFTRFTLRAAATQTRSPARALRQLNDAMLRQALDGPTDRFVTLVNARVVPRRSSVLVELAVGGHPFPVVVRESGTVEQVGEIGTVIGILRDVDVHDSEVTLLAGDHMVLVTDGVLEARDATGEEFGEERLLDVVRARAGHSGDVLAQAVVDAALTHAGDRRRDDIAVLVLTATPRR